MKTFFVDCLQIDIETSTERQNPVDKRRKNLLKLGKMSVIALSGM